MGDLAYLANDRSLLLPMYRRWLVDPALPFLPRRLSPNAITHAGHLLCLVAMALLLLVRPARGPLFVVAAILLQGYIWCDNADGAHARRTGQCSPLGELLDHGLDILNVVYIALMSAVTLGLPARWWPWLVAIIASASAMTYWEQAHRGVFELGSLNQVESGLVLTLIMLATAALGRDFWGTTVLGVASARALLVAWVGAAVGFGALGAGLRVWREHGSAPLAEPAMLVLATGSVLVAAGTGAVSARVAVVLVIGTSVFFAMRMFAARLGARRRLAPGLGIGTAAVLALSLAHAGVAVAWGRAPFVHADTLVATLGSLVFGFLVVRDVRRGMKEIYLLESNK